MSRDGRSNVLADSVNGKPVGKVNFVLRDSKDRIWVTVSTRVTNWMHALRLDLADGYLARLENGTLRIVADGFHFTNEIRFDAKEEFLYVVETTGGRITRLRIDDCGEVQEREIFGPSNLGTGAWPDGIAFDSYGNLWGTLVYSDKLFVLTPEGDMRVLLDEGDPVKVDRAGAGDRRESRHPRRAVRHRPGRRAVDGQRHVRRQRSADGLHRLAEGGSHPVLPRAGAGPADGALARGRQHAFDRIPTTGAAPDAREVESLRWRVDSDALPSLRWCSCFGAFDSSGLLGQQRRQEPGVAANFAADGAFTGSSLAGWRPVGGATWRAENGEIIATTGATGGWLIADKPFEDVSMVASFRCTGACRPACWCGPSRPRTAARRASSCPSPARSARCIASPSMPRAARRRGIG